MTLDRDTVRRIARLARIKIKDEELDHLAGELGHILSFVEQLNAVDTSNVEPMTSAVEVTLPMREDVVTEGGDAESILRNAPAGVHGFFAVPKVVE
ncbi:MAG TPA: Asp-tRNA(Asn)/Glu-tRNA(Gln) amidotransferase subunit GatC [Alphaproteobacteria bacterium]